MGDLPLDRLDREHQHPFHISGMDYVGPILVRDQMVQNSKISKIYSDTAKN